MDLMGGLFGPPPSVGLTPPGSATGILGASHSGGGGAPSGGGSGEMWLCRVCGNCNFAHRAECNLKVCGAPRGFPGPFTSAVVDAPGRGGSGSRPGSANSSQSGTSGVLGMTPIHAPGPSIHGAGGLVFVTAPGPGGAPPGGAPHVVSVQPVPAGAIGPGGFHQVHHPGPVHHLPPGMMGLPPGTLLRPPQ